MTHSHSYHAKDLLRFSVPMTLTAASTVLMGIIDSTMAGKLGVAPLAGVALGASIFFLFEIIGRGMAQGLTPLLASTVAKNNHDESESLISHSIIIQLVLGVTLTPILFWVTNNLHLFGQEPETSDFAESYLNVMGWFLLPQFLLHSFRAAIESHGNSKFPMMASYVVAGLNIFLNWVLIFGNLGAPRLELAGAALASGLSGLVLLMSLFFFLKNRFKMDLYSRLKDGIDKTNLRELLKFGGIFAFQWFIEVGAFSGSTFITGMYSKNHLAAHQITLNIASLMFMIPLGLGAAATIKISASLSKFGKAETRSTVTSYLFTCWGATLFTSVMILLTKDIIPPIYTDDASVISLASGALMLAAMFQFADGTQAVSSGILRGYLDVKTPTIIIAVCWWAITIPAGYYLTITRSYGIYGMWSALAGGLFLAATCISIRLLRVRNKT